MGGPNANIRGFWRLRICSHLGLGPFLRPLPGRWGQGRGGPESGDLDTLSYPSRGRDFNLDLVQDVADRSLSAMPNAQQRRNIFASATMKPDLVVSEAGSDPRGHLGVTWGVYLCAGKPPLADIILSHPPELTRCDSVIGLAIPATSGHIQYRGAASWDLYIRISGINRVLLS